MRAPEDLYKDVLDALDEGVHVIDREGNTVFYNRQMGELEGMDSGQVVGKPLLEVFPCLSPETSTLLKVLETGAAIKNRVQTYLTISGKQVTTVNSSYPIKINDRTIAACEIAKDITDLENMNEEILELKQRIIPANDQFEQTDGLSTLIIGNSDKIKNAIDYTRKIANPSSNVLIFGETGTGKELFAKEIHRMSQRRDKPFITQNCAALPEDLVEGILFGTVKGGFTGAVNRPGLFQQAHKGTMLLDEIHTLPLHLQAKLLRVLEEGEVRPVGGKGEQKVDVRVITTMNTDPIKAMEDEKLRPDLYYRVSIVNVFLPPLRNRKEDIMPLIDFFLKNYQEKFQKEIAGFDGDLMQKLIDYSWPGNVRELEHAVEAAMNVVESGEKITFYHLPPLLQQNLNKIDLEEKVISDSNLAKREGGVFKGTEEDDYSIETLPDKLERIERDMIAKQLKQNYGNISQTAELLGISRQALQYKIRKYKLE